MLGLEMIMAMTRACHWLRAGGFGRRLHSDGILGSPSGSGTISNPRWKLAAVALAQAPSRLSSSRLQVADDVCEATPRFSDESVHVDGGRDFPASVVEG